MKAFDFNGKKISLPDSWSEVTVAYYLREEFTRGDTIGLISALAGVEAKELANCDEDLSSQFKQVFAFLKDDPIEKWINNRTKEVNFLGEKITLPYKLELEWFGCKIMAQEQMFKHEHKALPYCLAIYLGKAGNIENWWDRVDELAEEVKKLPIKEMLPYWSFFLPTLLSK